MLSMDLQRTRERLALLLIALLPFHAFAVTVGTKLIAGPGHAPLTALSVWKEILLLVILSLSLIEAVRLKMENGKWKITDLRIDLIDLLIVLLGVLALTVSYFQSSIFNLQFLYGFKYDFTPLIAFLILRRVPWSEQFAAHVKTVLLSVGAIVSAYAIISLWLPQSVFTMLGYSDLHSLYVSHGPLAAFQQIEGLPIHRAQSTFSGPNQFGLWLLLPLGFIIVSVFNKQLSAFSFQLLGVLIVISIFLSMSRAAVLSAGVMIAVFLASQRPFRRCVPLALSLLCITIVLLFAIHTYAPGILLRATSTRGHIARPLEAVRLIAAHPFGRGLGTAGPASNRTSDTCVYLPGGSDISWAEDRPELCVFVDDVQMQPEAPCSCPLLPENWYLQIGIEMGVLGLVLYLLLILLVLQELRITHHELQSTYLAFLGISIAALFLHAWEDSAVAYSVWILVASTLTSPRAKI